MPFVALALASLLAIAMPAFSQDDAPAANTNAASADDGISELPEAMQAQAKQMLAMMKLDQQKDPAKLKMAMSALEAQMANVPEEAKPLMEFVQKKIQARIDELEAGAADTASDAKTDAAPTAGASDAAPAAEPAPVAVPAEAQQAMDAFIHSVLIGRADLAKSAAEVLLNTNVTPSQAAQIVDTGGFAERFQRALESSRAMPEVSTLATELGKKVDAGRLDLARDPARIDAAVTNLNGTLRQQTFAMRSLEAAGAYAMPALIRAFTAGASSSQELMAERAILNIGRNAVLPLCESLNGLPAGQQVRVIRVLGELGSKIAAPWIASVANAKGATSDVRQAASEAMSRMGVSSTDQNALWTSMARSFIVGAEGLLPYPAEMQQPTWRFDGDHGLMPKMVSTGVYCDIMAQRCALQAMNSDAGNGTALAVYLAAGLRLEAQETATEVASPLSPSSLVQAAGPMVGRQVLGLGVEIGDAGLQLQAIRALSKTGGPTTLVSGSEQNPLIACLDSANRRVRVEAALAVARAMPSTSFPRANAVVPTLAATLREGGHLAAGVVAMQAEDRTQIESWLRAQGFDVMGSTESASALRTAMTGHGSADLVVVAGDPTFVSNQGRALRGDALTSSAMLLLAVPEQDAVRVDRSLRDSRSANVWFLGSSGETFNGAVKVLMNRASGGMPSAEDMATLAMDSSDALIGIGRVGGGPFRMIDAEGALIDGLSRQQGDLRARIAMALALVPSQSAQRALLSAALKAEGDDRAMLLRATAESARRFGDKADPTQVDRLRALLVDGKGAEGAAAAECYGALNLGPQESIKLILK